MIGLGMVAATLAALVLWMTRGGRQITSTSRVGRIPLGRILPWAVPVLPTLPLLANSTGWLFTETARQPWLVFGLFKTAAGVSPGTTTTEVIATLSAFTVVYGALAVGYVLLVLRLAGAALDGPAPPVHQTSTEPVQSRELASW